MSDKLKNKHVDYVGRVDELVSRGSGCLFAGPGRGDCHNFLGLPHVLDETTTDVYGKPEEWWWSCWKDEKLGHLTARNAELVEALEFYADKGIWSGIGMGVSRADAYDKGHIARAALERSNEQKGDQDHENDVAG